MKVNTDGVLLGAWQQPANARHILDIGTGTGVIALMMAQKNPDAIIHAVDIDIDAYQQATENFEQSRWKDRLSAFHTSLQNYQPNIQYDLIISNPPYFINDFKTDSRKKNIARHSIELSYQDLLKGISRLLAINGKALIVLPIFNFHLFKTEAALNGLFTTCCTEVIAVSGKSPYLALLQLERSQIPYSRTTLTIQNEAGNFTAAYKSLSKDFYLKF